MKRFVIALIMVMVSVSSSFANTIMWYWRDGSEVIQYTVDVDESIGTIEMNNFNLAITSIARASNYSNLEQLESLINKTANGSIRNFQIIDVIVDEK